FMPDGSHAGSKAQPRLSTLQLPISLFGFQTLENRRSGYLLILTHFHQVPFLRAGYFATEQLSLVKRFRPVRHTTNDRSSKQASRLAQFGSREPRKGPRAGVSAK